MRYVIVDMDGASREYFSSRRDVREALQELDGEHPGIASDLLVVTYGDDGRQVGEPESAAELLDSVVTEPLLRLGAGSTRFLMTDLWSGIPSTGPVATAASGSDWPVLIPSNPVPTRPYEYESKATETVA